MGRISANPGSRMKLIIDLAQNDEGAWIGSVIIPGLNVKGTPLMDIAVKNSEMSFAIKSSGRGLPAAFSADMNADEYFGSKRVTPRLSF